MSIFEGMDPEQIWQFKQRMAPSNQGLMGHGIGNENMISTGGPPGSGSTTPYDLGGQGQAGIPEPPPLPGGGQSDVSGFANAGMTPPALPDPMQQIGGIMALAGGDPHKYKREAQPMQQGSLMAYLQQLGVV